MNPQGAVMAGQEIISIAAVSRGPPPGSCLCTGGPGRSQGSHLCSAPVRGPHQTTPPWAFPSTSSKQPLPQGHIAPILLMSRLRLRDGGCLPHDHTVSWTMSPWLEWPRAPALSASPWLPGRPLPPPRALDLSWASFSFQPFCLLVMSTQSLLPASLGQ